MYIRNFQLAVGYTLNIAVSYFRSYWLLFARCTPVAYYTIYSFNSSEVCYFNSS